MPFSLSPLSLHAATSPHHLPGDKSYLHDAMPSDVRSAAAYAAGERGALDDVDPLAPQHPPTGPRPRDAAEPFDTHVSCELAVKRGREGGGRDGGRAERSGAVHQLSLGAGVIA